MTCYRSKDDWHSYFKKNFDEMKLADMRAHLSHCPECQHLVLKIQETAEFLAEGRITVNPPASLKINVMMTIDKNRYRESPANVELQGEQPSVAARIHPDTYNFKLAKKKTTSSHHFELKNWGLSMVAAGVLLFALNLSSLTPNFKSAQIDELNSEISSQIALPFDKMSQLSCAVLEKISSLTVYQSK